MSTHAPSTSRWQRIFAIDLRSLALFRIAIGALVIACVGLRLRNFSAFYTEEGVWPAAVAWGEDFAPGTWSLNFLADSSGWQMGLAAAEAAAGLALLLGWRTRVVTVLAWVLVASAHRRNIMIVSGASHLLRQCLFWGMWLPLGARWSLDAVRQRKSAENERPGDAISEAGGESLSIRHPSSVISVASAALLLQIALVYVANAIYKSDAAWRTTGEAIWMTLSQECYSRPAGRELLAWPFFLRVVTHAVYALEAFGPLLAFSPWRTARCRLLAVVLFVTFHASLAVTMQVGPFPFISIGAWLVFLPGELWDELATRFRKPFAGWFTSEPGSSIKATRLANVAACICFALVIVWNLRPAFPLLKRLDPIGRVLRFEQRWAMFAPKPRQVDTWWVVVGTDAGGIETNLWTGESPVNWKRPRDFDVFFPNDTWKLYFHNLRAGSAPRAQLFAEWLARRWLAQHPGTAPFAKLEVYQLEEFIHSRGSTPDNYLLYDSSQPAAKPRVPETP